MVVNLNSKLLNNLYTEVFKKSHNYLFLVDQKGKIIDCNDASCKLFNMSLKKLSERNIIEIFGYKENIWIRFFQKKLLYSNNEYETHFTTSINKKIIYYNLHIVCACNNKLYYIVYLKDKTEESKLIDMLNKASYESIRLLAQVIEEKDAYTLGHCSRLEEHSIALGEKLGLKDEYLRQLRFGAILHDVGKVAIPNEILNKQEKLTPKEFEIIKSHSEIGANIVRKIYGLEKVANMVKQHHERYDGNGYPEGIKGNKIELGAQIISVVDAFDAMTSDRPYHKAINLKDAVNELQKQSGSQFAPKIVEKFIWLLKKTQKREFI